MTDESVPRQTDYIWTALLQRARETMDRVEQGAAESDGRRDLLDWWSAVAAVLNEYAIRVAKGPAPDPPPAEVASVVGKIAGYLASGYIPPQIRGVVVAGRREPGPDENRDMGFAVAYRLACKKGGLAHLGSVLIVKDRRPIVTLSKWYRVSRRTIQNWVASVPPAHLGAVPLNLSQFSKAVRQAAARYCRHGRSEKAQALRGKKG